MLVDYILLVREGQILNHKALILLDVYPIANTLFFKGLPSCSHSWCDKDRSSGEYAGDYVLSTSHDVSFIHRRGVASTPEVPLVRCIIWARITMVTPHSASQVLPRSHWQVCAVQLYWGWNFVMILILFTQGILSCNTLLGNLSMYVCMYLSLCRQGIQDF